MLDESVGRTVSAPYRRSDVIAYIGAYGRAADPRGTVPWGGTYGSVWPIRAIRPRSGQRGANHDDRRRCIY